MAFESDADNLVAGDNNSARDIFVVDRQTGSVARVDRPTDGTQGNGHSGNPAISEDGRILAFASDSDNLVPADTNNRGDIFARELMGPRPVVFVPGISGSVLIDPSAGDREIWIRNLADWSDLSLFPSDDPSLVVASDALRVATVAVPLLGEVGSEQIYGPFLQRMAVEGFHEYDLTNDSGAFVLQRMFQSGCDTAQADDDGPKPILFVFPYDWRQDIGFNSARLRGYIRCVREFYPDSDLDIVAHSMGSMLSRAYILDNPADHYVNALITIGGPFLGAPKLLYVLETGDFLGPPLSAVPGVNSTFKHLARSFTGAHQLLPSRKYFELAAEMGAAQILVEYDRDLNSNGAFEVLSYPQTIEVVDLLYGQEGFTPGSSNDAFHQGGQDDWRGDTSGVKYFHMVGKQAGHNTIGGVVATWETQCLLAAAVCYSPEPIVKLEFTNGDGTVPVLSAARYIEVGGGLLLDNLNAPDAQVVVASALSPSQNGSVSHNGMMLNPAVQDQVLQWLQEAAAASPSGSAAPSGAAVATAAVHPYNYVTISGAESVVLQDSSGNSTAPVGGIFVGQVPGVTTYFLGENVRLLAIPTSSTEEYNLSFQTTSRPIGIEVRVGTGDTTTRAVRYSDLALPNNASAQLTISPTGPQELAYDSDGDGTFESTVQPGVDVTGPTAEDRDPPLITVREDLQGGSSRITLSAEDPSGVLRLLISLDGTNYQAYTGPLTLVSQRTPVLYAFADDNLANRATLVHELRKNATPIPAMTWWGMLGLGILIVLVLGLGLVRLRRVSVA